MTEWSERGRMDFFQGYCGILMGVMEANPKEVANTNANFCKESPRIFKFPNVPPSLTLASKPNGVTDGSYQMSSPKLAANI